MRHVDLEFDRDEEHLMTSEHSEIATEADESNHNSDKNPSDLISSHEPSVITLF